MNIAPLVKKAVAPRKEPRPLLVEGRSPVAIEVELLVKLDDQAVLECQIPRSRTELVEPVVPAEHPVEGEDASGRLGR